MRIWHFGKREFETHNRRFDFGGDDKSSAEQGIQQAGRSITEASQMTGPESEQYGRSFEIGKLLDQISRYQQGLGAAPAGYQTGEQQYQQGGDLAKAYYQQTMAGTQDPYGAYESALGPQLQLAQDQINRSAQSRGLYQSGIPIEQMGRAGVDLAIKEAQDRMNFRSQELARGGELSQYARGVGQENLANMSGIYGAQQGYGQQAMNRQAQGAVNAAQYMAYPGQAALGSYYGGQAALQALPGQAIGAAGTAAGAYFNPLGTAAKAAQQVSQTATTAPQTAYDYQAQLGNQAQQFGRSAIKYPWET